MTFRNKLTVNYSPETKIEKIRWIISIIVNKKIENPLCVSYNNYNQTSYIDLLFITNYYIFNFFFWPWWKWKIINFYIQLLFTSKTTFVKPYLHQTFSTAFEKSWQISRKLYQHIDIHNYSWDSDFNSAE